MSNFFNLFKTNLEQLMNNRIEQLEKFAAEIDEKKSKMDPSKKDNDVLERDIERLKNLSDKTMQNLKALMYTTAVLGKKAIEAEKQTREKTVDIQGKDPFYDKKDKNGIANMKLPKEIEEMGYSTIEGFLENIIKKGEEESEIVEKHEEILRTLNLRDSDVSKEAKGGIKKMFKIFKDSGKEEEKEEEIEEDELGDEEK